MEDASRLLNPLPPGAVVRIDEGDDKVDLADDKRLAIAGALVDKFKDADPATAERMANAAQALLAPMVRADDTKKDEEVKSEISGARPGKQPESPPRPGSSPLNRRDPAEAGKHSADNDDDGHEEKERRLMDDDNRGGKDPFQQVMDALDGISERLDALEKRRGHHDDDDASGSEADPTSGAPLGPEDGTPRQLAADAEKARKEGFNWRIIRDRFGKLPCSAEAQDAFVMFQARADKVYDYHGMSADKPQYGETLIAYRRRLLHPFKHLSPAFKNSDLKVLAVDPAGFEEAENTIYADAEREGRNPTTVPLGILRERVEQRGGHQYTTFYGKPISWMGSFMPRGRRVQKMVERNDSEQIVQVHWQRN
jgi:hypothetical protein